MPGNLAACIAYGIEASFSQHRVEALNHFRGQRSRDGLFRHCDSRFDLPAKFDDLGGDLFGFPIGTSEGRVFEKAFLYGVFVHPLRLQLLEALVGTGEVGLEFRHLGLVLPSGVSACKRVKLIRESGVFGLPAGYICVQIRAVKVDDPAFWLDSFRYRGFRGFENWRFGFSALQRFNLGSGFLDNLFLGPEERVSLRRQ